MIEVVATYFILAQCFNTKAGCRSIDPNPSYVTQEMCEASKRVAEEYTQRENAYSIWYACIPVKFEELKP